MTSRKPSNEPRLIIIGDYLFDPLDSLLSGPSGAHHVCPRLAALLVEFLENPRQVLKREQLIATIWPDESDASASLTQCVGRLRQYFGDTARAARYIETVPQRGYRLVAPVYGSKRTAAVHRPDPAASAGAGGRLYALVQEFRDRKVCRATLIYAIVIWLVFQVSEVVVPALGLPEWVNSLVVVLGILGFPIAATLAWVFDLTPSGLVRERSAPADRTAGPARKRSDFVFDTVLVAAALVICALLMLSSTNFGDLNLTEAKAQSGVAGPAGAAQPAVQTPSSCLDLLTQSR
jgi:DNA-binding winged helix-turn-helix (wHTH) protein